MPEPAEPQTTPPPLDLKDPVIAGFLAWLVPGLGHLYQGRRAKAAIYFVCIMSTFLYGLYLGSNPHIGWGRVVYFSLRPSDVRLYYFGQIGVGLPALPALVQYNRVINGKEPLWHHLMAPPKLTPAEGGPQSPSAHDLQRHLQRFFELGSVYTLIAGLLNILAIYDACCGPVAEPAKKEDEDEKQEEK